MTWGFGETRSTCRGRREGQPCTTKGDNPQVCHNCKYTVTLCNPHYVPFSILDTGNQIQTSHDGQYRDYKSTFEADMEYEPETEFPHIEAMESST